jgi:hypothetical protein
MVTLVSRLFTALNSRIVGPVRVNMPMINSIATSAQNVFSEVSQTRKKRALMAWYKHIPELTAFVNKVAIDSTSRWHFTTVSPTESGRNKILKANKFAQAVVLGQTMNSQMSDMLITGDGFGWMGFLRDKDVRDKIRKSVNRSGLFLELKEKHKLFEDLYSKAWTDKKQVEGFHDTSAIDEDLLRPRKYRCIASSTVEILFNQFDIFGYRQLVGTNVINFDPKEIIHFTLMKRDGKVNGFTPVEAVLVQLELLRQMWQNQLSLHRNGGSPDKIFSLENVNPNSPAFRNIEQQLSKYRIVENKHGNMLWTGKLQVHELQQLDQMQFKDLGLYITGLVAMQWGIPKSSIPYIIGSANTKENTGGNEERGYWEVVKNFQENFSEIMNTQLWIPHFGVKIAFMNPFLQMDIQNENARMIKLNNVITMDDILGRADKRLKPIKRLRLLDLTSEDVEDIPEEERMITQEQTASGMGTGAQMGEREATRSDGETNISKRKREEQANTMASAGVPTGVGKEKQTKLTEVKQNLQIVDLSSFVKIYQEDRAFNPGMPPRILRRKFGDLTTLEFASSDFMFRTVLKDENSDSNRVLLMNLAGNIRDV